MSRTLFTAGDGHKRHADPTPTADTEISGPPFAWADIPLGTLRLRRNRIGAWAVPRRSAAALAITGVAAGGVVNVARAIRLGEDLGLVIANYVSMFTIVSSIATIVVLLLAARRSGPLAAPQGVESRPMALAFATTSTAMIILAVVYNAILRGLPPNLATPDPWWVAALDRWATESLHVAFPVYLVIDVLFAPRRRRLGWTALAGIVGIPLLWAVYTMIRGPLVPAPDGSAPYWYPYPFLDPNGAAGYQTPMIYIGVIAAAFLALGSLMIALTRRRRPSRLHIDHHRVPRGSLRGRSRHTGSTARHR